MNSMVFVSTASVINNAMRRTQLREFRAQICDDIVPSVRVAGIALRPTNNQGGRNTYVPAAKKSYGDDC